MRQKGNYERAEEYLEEIDDDIEFEYGAPYSQLSEDDKKQAILEHFFKGLPQYDGSARDLRDGIHYTSTTREPEISIDRVNFRYGERTVQRRVVRGADGRFRKWV